MAIFSPVNDQVEYMQKERKNNPIPMYTKYKDYFLTFSRSSLGSGFPKLLIIFPKIKEKAGIAAPLPIAPIIPINI